MTPGRQRGDGSRPGQARHNGTRCARRHGEHPPSSRTRRSKCNSAGGEDLKASMTVEHTKPGSAQDDQLRREQAKAVFDLLASVIQREGDSDGC